MATDVEKRLEKARKYLEKGRHADAIEEYQAALDLEPTNLEALQALADLHSRQGDTARAARYYGTLFDRHLEAGEGNRAAVLYSRFLRSVAQPPERMARYALLLQNQNKTEEALEQYAAAAEQFVRSGKPADALTCWERLTQLDPDTPERHLTLAEAAEGQGRNDLAARGFFRAAQLVLATGELNRALELFDHAHRLVPEDRSVALFFAEAQMRKPDPQRAVELLEPFPTDEMDANFLAVYADALLGAGQLERARETLDRLWQLNPDGVGRYFDLAELYLKAGRVDRAVDLLDSLRERLRPLKRENEWVSGLDRISDAYPHLLRLVEYCARVYEELNREAKYFDVLARLFDLLMKAGQANRACETLERLVEIDAYDHGHQPRLAALVGKADSDRIRAVESRLAQVSGASSGGIVVGGSEAEPAPGSAASAGSPAENTLEDLIVQAEIFLQYSLRAKVVERLEKIAELFPGEERSNPRLRRLYDLAKWGPGSSAPSTLPAPGREAPEPPAPSANPEMLRDLAKISEINRLLYRQGSPMSVLSAAVNETGKYLRVARCLAVVGTPGQPPQAAAEYCAPGVEPSRPPNLIRLLGQLSETAPDADGRLVLDAATAPMLRDLGIATALAVVLTDKETQAPAGMLILGRTEASRWKPTEGYFLEAVGDQVIISVNHTRLRSLVRNLAMADEKTGLLGRGSYQDCLLAEANRAKTQGTPLSVVLFQVDRGRELLRQEGEATLDRYMEELARALTGSVRQNDLAVKYTAWALAFILPDTALDNAAKMAEKVRGLSSGVAPPRSQRQLTFSAGVVEAVTRPDYDSEDIVTDLINRAEHALEEARTEGGDTVVVLENLNI
jgi:diguanylate cyclase (GGDEF)-like protein